MASVLSNGYWLHRSIERSVTLFYALDSVRFTAKALERVTPTVHDLTPFEKEGCIHAARICLELDESRIVTGVR